MSGPSISAPAPPPPREYSDTRGSSIHNHNSSKASAYICTFYGSGFGRAQLLMHRPKFIDLVGKHFQTFVQTFGTTVNLGTRCQNQKKLLCIACITLKCYIGELTASLLFVAIMKTYTVPLFTTLVIATMVLLLTIYLKDNVDNINFAQILDSAKVSFFIQIMAFCCSINVCTCM